LLRGTPADDRAVTPRRAAGLARRRIGAGARPHRTQLRRLDAVPDVSGQLRRRAGRRPGRGRRGRAQLSTFAEASYGLPLEQLEQIQALAAGPPDVVAEKLHGYVAAGARHLAVRIATTSLETQREQLERIIKLKEYLP
jgi:hypothetical protein